jgi:hypothetical protein
MKKAALFSLWALLLVGLLSAQSQKKTESLWAKLLRITGVSSTPASLRSEDHVTGGEIWWVPLTGQSVPRRLTHGGRYYSPVFEAQGQSVLALNNGDLFRIRLSSGVPVKMYKLASVTKLVGLSRDDSDQLLVIGEDIQQHAPFVALVSIGSGKLTVIPHNPQSNDDRVMLAHLAGWERVYGDTRLYTEKNEKEGIGGTTLSFTDVYLKSGNNAPVNLTQGNRVSSSQPSLSADGHKVVFIREER